MASTAPQPGPNVDIDDRERGADALRVSELSCRQIVDGIPGLVAATGALGEVDARSLLDNMPGFLARHSPDGTPEIVNRPFLQYHGKTVEEVRQWRTSDIVHPEDLAHTIEGFGKGISGGLPWELEFRLRRFDGIYRWFQARWVPLRDAEGRLLHWNVLTTDIDDRKRAEEALIRARAELAHMARVTTLTALTASIAHDVNQPIAAAITSAGACLRWLNRDQPDVQRAREAARRIEEDGKRASEIITHLRSFYKKEALPYRELVSINDLVDEMLMLLRSEADRHSVVMRTDLSPALPPVSSDRVQLQQVLMNLMLNGMEAMDEPGELTISTRWDGGMVTLSVRDTGAGIPTDNMEEIFNAFVTTKAGGTGMGLAISRTIIESHSGRLWATVNRDRGATFHFSLPTGAEV